MQPAQEQVQVLNSLLLRGQLTSLGPLLKMLIFDDLGKFGLEGVPKPARST